MIEVYGYWFGIVEYKCVFGGEIQQQWYCNCVDWIDVLQWIDVDVVYDIGCIVVEMFGDIVMCCFMQCDGKQDGNCVNCDVLDQCGVYRWVIVVSVCFGMMLLKCVLNVCLQVYVGWIVLVVVYEFGLVVCQVDDGGRFGWGWVVVDDEFKLFFKLILNGFGFIEWFVIVGQLQCGGE